MHNEILASYTGAPVACVDVGGTKVAVSIADGHGIRGRVAEPTIKQGDNGAMAQQVIRMVALSCAEAGVAPSQLRAVGVAACGPFVLRNAEVEIAAPNICGGLAGPQRGLPNSWTTARLEGPLRTAFPGVRVENDGVGALEAERRWGALQGCNNCAYVTWSTGIGMGLCVDGRILRGKNGNAGHVGHTFVSDNSDALCGCGLTGDVEGLIAGNAIPRRFGSLGYGGSTQLFAAMRAGDVTAKAVVDELCRIMGRTLFNMTATLDLQRIAVGGSVFWNNREFLLPRIRAYVDGKLPALTEGLQIVEAGLGERVGDFAALALVME